MQDAYVAPEALHLHENILQQAGPAEPGLGLGLLIALPWPGRELWQESAPVAKGPLSNLGSHLY